MFKFCSLYSSSSGNCFFVQTDTTKILIDAGVSTKKIIEALSSIDIDINDINAILITHEHVDHTKSIGNISKKYNIPIYANIETWSKLEKEKVKILKENQKEFIPHTYFNIGNLKIFPFQIPHDAINPCGFNIYYKKQKLSIATDLGHINNTLIKYLKNSSFLLIESNYDSEILKVCSYSYLLKKRIAGPNRSFIKY